MRPVSVSVSSATTSALVVLDHYSSPATVALGVKIVGTSATYKVEHTFDDPFDPAFTPAGAVWMDHATLVAKTANADGNYAYPPRACRLSVSAIVAAVVTLTVNPAGII